jgi:HEAT repeat protein
MRHKLQNNSGFRRKARLCKNISQVILWISLLTGFAPEVSHAQPADARITVANVSTHAAANGTGVSITADGPLNRAQTWQDSEGYHVVVPAATTQGNLKTGRGVKVRRLGSSIEILVQTKPGANVSLQLLSNRLNLTIEGKLEPHDAPNYVDDNSKSAEESALSRGESQRVQQARQSAPGGTGDTTSAVSEAAPQNSATPAVQPNSLSVPDPETNDSWFSAVFSDSWILIIIGAGLVLLFAARRMRARRAASEGWIDVNDEAFGKVVAPEKLANQRVGRRPGPERNEALAKQNASGASEVVSQRKTAVSGTVAVPVELYGAYRVDQEVGKLVLGQPHRMDVLASRAPDDRRAIEASLLKVLTMSDSDDDERRRAREALEEYGFVAQQSAMALLASDPYDRTSAAKMLGDIQSPASLPFLLEALYDHESIVRNQAVLSIGELKLPSAIGALLDIARKHSDVPGALLSRALSACSVEGLDFFDSPMPEPGLLSAGYTEPLAHEFSQLEPASAVQDLPESADDERLTEALSKLESADANERSEAIRTAAQFAVKSSVTALGKVARADQQAAIRSLAITSLAAINHESVFPAVLIGMADESREVRAAAARSLSRLSFDRADAYVRVMETHDPDSLRDVAQACIKAGIVSQGIDRLASSDRRQVYEAFSIVSLLAKANMIEPILDAIANHPNLDLRLTALRLLETTGEPAVLEQLRQLASREGMPEAIKSALLQITSKSDETPSEESHGPTEVEGQPAESEIESSGLPASGVA